MMNLKKYSWLAVLPMVFTACQEDTLVNDQSQQDGIYNLSATVDKNAPMSRAQVVLGGTSTETETFHWNAEDALTVFEYDNAMPGVTEHTFNISADYDGSSATAEFTTTDALTASKKFTAIYPAMSSDNGTLTLQMDTRFTLADNSESSWVNYFSKNMYMLATGTVEEGMSLNMQHLCSLLRVTYTNSMEQDVVLYSVGATGHVCGYRTFSASNVNESASDNGRYDIIGVRFENGLTVAPGATEDFYILVFSYFDEENYTWTGLNGFTFAYPNNVYLSTPTTYNGQEFNVPDLNPGSSYWFNITQTDGGLVWTKDANQGEEEEASVIFSNKEFSKALYAVLGADKVSFDADSCGVMTQANVDEVTSLNFNDYADKANITSLDGIENFANLQNLSCSGTALSYVKLTNSELHTVELTHNQLEKIDISSLTSLQKLDVNNNKLNDAGINIVSPLLTEFYFNSTAITFASIPDECIANMTWMNCGDTGLSGTVDLSAFTSLGGLYIAENNIENLILPENNKISLLDVSGNGREMEGVATVDLTRCPNLWYFSSQYANYASLDFSNCPNIEHLYCNDNYIEELDLTNNEKIGLLYCGGQRENVTLKLTLPKSLEEKWTNEWAGKNERVDVNFVDASEEVATVTIENAEFAAALQAVLGAEKVTINESNYGVMKEEDVLAIIELNFDNYDGTISTLSGIEYFTSLKTLYCRNVYLKECDFSQNVNLSYVNIQGNNLSSLDFSNCPSLTTLICSYMSELTDLNLSGCNFLNNLQAQSTSITSLEIPNPQAMSNFLVPSGLSVDLTLFTKLSGLGLSGRGLENLDMIPANLKEQLGYLVVDDNDLTSLNLTEYPKLWGLSCIFNKISSLDITSCSSLTSLYCGNQKNEAILTLTLTEEQKLTWDSTWASNNANVTLNVVSSGNAGGGTTESE